MPLCCAQATLPRSPGGPHPTHPRRHLAAPPSPPVPGTPHPPAGECGAHCLVASLSWGAAPARGILCALRLSPSVVGAPRGRGGVTHCCSPVGRRAGPQWASGHKLNRRVSPVIAACPRGGSSRAQALQSAGPSPSLSGPGPSCDPRSTQVDPLGPPRTKPLPQAASSLSAVDGPATPGIGVTHQPGGCGTLDAHPLHAPQVSVLGSGLVPSRDPGRRLPSCFSITEFGGRGGSRHVWWDSG